MLIYSLPMILCLILHFIKLDDKKTKLFFYIIIIYLTLISAIRYNVGQDYKHWVDVYSWIEEGKTGGEYVEVGYRILNIIIQKIPFLNVYCLYGITSTFIILGFGYSIKKNVDQKYWFLAIFIFIGSGIFFATLNLVRQYISIVIILLALPFLKEKKYVKYCISVIIATLFHTSSLIMLLFLIFYVLFNSNKHEKTLIIIYGISLFFMIIDIRNIIAGLSFLIPDRWKWYLQSDFINKRNYSAIVKQLIPNALLIFAMIKRKKIIEDKKENDIYLLMLYVNVIITNCFYGILVLLRFSYFFDISLIFIVPIIVDLLKDYNKKIQILGNISIWGYYTLLTIVTIFIMNGHGVMPYKTLFSLLMK